MLYVFNPLSDRLIGVGKTLYKSLIRKGVLSGNEPVYEIPNNDIKWIDISPKATKDRISIHKRCGGKCFLQPNSIRPKYPICTGKNKCKLSCKALKSAMRIARIRKDNKILKLAIRVFKKNCKV